MEENTTTTTTIETTSQESQAEDTQTTQADESVDQTTQSNESESTESDNQETSTEESKESDSADQRLAKVEKALKDTQAAFTKKAQEAAELKRQQDAKQFEMQISQVSNSQTQLQQEYQQYLSGIKQQKAQLIAEARTQLLDGQLDPASFDNYLNQLDAQYEQTKQQLDMNYFQVEQQIKAQNAELFKTAKENFKAENKEFFERPYMKNVLAECEKAGYSANDLATVKQLAEMLIKDYEAHNQNQTNLTSENNSAKERLNSAAGSGNNPPTGGQHIFTKAELKEMQQTPQGRAKFLKNEKAIFDQMQRGLIK